MAQQDDLIAVTGAAGFIGSNLCTALLSEGYRVIGIDDLSSGTEENLPLGVDFRKIDLRLPEIAEHFEGASHVFHLGAKSCLADCSRRPVEATSVNVMGTANVMKASVSAEVPHVIYADTSSEYEGIFEFPSVIGIIKPISVYGSTKRGGALVCEAFQNYYPDVLQVTTLRYFNVYGPAQDWLRVVPPVMSAFARKLILGEQPIIYGDGSKSRDFIHVDDVNRFHLMILKNPSLRGRVYNVGSGEDHSILEVFEKIEARVKSGLVPRFESDLPQEAQKTQADLTETLKTGWRPLVDFEEGLAEFVDYTAERVRNGRRLLPPSLRADLSRET